VLTYFGQITLFIRCQYSMGLDLWLGLGLMYSASEMTYIVSSGALNSTHSLTRFNVAYK